MYRVFYFNRTGRNLIISCNKNNKREWKIEWPHRAGCCTEWTIMLGKLYIHSQTPKSATEV